MANNRNIKFMNSMFWYQECENMFLHFLENVANYKDISSV